MTIEHPPLTLDQFSAQIDDHLNYPAGFAEHVRAVADVREIIARASERRAASYTELKARFASGGQRVFHLGGGERRVLVERTTKIRYVKAVSSAAAKKADAKLYRQAKVLKGWRSVTVPGDHVSALEVPKLPPLPWTGADLAAVAKLWTSPDWKIIGEMGAAEDEHFDALAKIAADAGWDGQEYAFTDGWHVKLTEPRYSSEAFRALAPELWNSLAVLSERGGNTRLDIVDYDKAVEEGLIDDDDDLDEIDGD